MPRRKAAEVELLPPEEDQPIRGRKKLVEAEHTIKYSAPVPVTVEDEPAEDESFSDVDIVETERKQKRKTAKTERDELRKKMLSHGVTAASPLKLIIEKYAHSDGPDSGTTAEKSHCTKYGCDEAHLLSQDYMNVAARWGAGRYWFTLYKDGTIVTQWEKKLELPSGPVIQRVNPNDPNSPQVIVQTTNGDGQAQQIPMSIKDIMKTQREALKEQLEMAKLMREAYGFAPEQSQQQQQTTDPELAALQLITKNPDVMEKIAGGIAKSIFGGKGVADDTPWWADILKDSITTGQLAPTVQGVVKALFPNGLFGGLFPGGNNGQAQVATAPLQTNRPVDNQQSTDGRTVIAQEIPQGNQSLQPANGEVDQQGGMPLAPQDPYAQMLTGVITTLANNGPVEDAVRRVDGFLLMAPQYTETIDAQFSQPAENLLGAISTIPGCEQIAQTEHAKGWIESFQAKFFEESQEGEE
jgi:hypothetical protein